MNADNFNIDSATMDESDSSSQPPPGRPGDTEDFFVPCYQMSAETSQPHVQKPKARIKNIQNEEKTNTNSKYTTKDANDDIKKEHHHDNNNQNQNQNLNHSHKKKKIPNDKYQDAISINSDSMTTPTPSNNSHNKRNITGNINNKFYAKQTSMQRDFSRATKWDIVYLTSSPLVFGSDPYKPLDQLDISGERDSFFNTLKSSKQKLRVIHKTATTSNIIAAVTGGCRCIHYSGHGYPSYLAFEDAKRIGETHLVHYDLIRKVCEDEDQRIEFVFASACHSEHVGEAFIEAGIQHVVAVNTKFEVTDEAASMFTKHFYNTLLNGRTIEKSFKIAKHAVAAMPSSARLDYDKFLLLPRNGDHGVNIFGNLSPGELIDDTLRTPVNNLPPAVPSFVGRAIDMRHIIHQLMDSGVRLLVLTGNCGIGKSATALMVARYFCDRRMFRGGIFFIDVKKLNNQCKTLSSMLLRVFEECNIHGGVKGVKGDDGSDASGSEGNNNTNEQGNDDDKNNNNSKKDDVFNIIRNMGEMLLVFDGLDQFGENRVYGNNRNTNRKRSNNQHINNNMSEIEIQDSIQAFLQNIFEKCSIDTKVLVTSSKKLHMFADFTNCISRYYMLRKLKPKDAAKLFSRLCNSFRHTDIVSSHELMRILEYNPKQITRIVQIKHQYHCDTLEKIVKAYNTKIHLQHQQEYRNQQKEAENAQQQQINNTINKPQVQAQAQAQHSQLRKEKQLLMEKFISRASARVLWSESNGIETVSYMEIFTILKREFREQTNSQRTFEQNDLIEAFKKFGGMQNYMISIQNFNAIYEWFLGVIDLIRVLFEEWNEQHPCAIAGFITREMAIKRLQQMQCGAFIIRFSTSSSKSIAISYKDIASVEHIKGTLISQTSKFLFAIKNHQSNQCEMSLASFIQKFKKITTLYDIVNNQTHAKVDVYFGRGKIDNHKQLQMTTKSNHSNRSNPHNMNNYAHSAHSNHSNHSNPHNYNSNNAHNNYNQSHPSNMNYAHNSHSAFM